MRFDDRIVLRCGAYGAQLSALAGARMTALTWHDGGRDRDLLVPCDPASVFDPHDWPKAGAFAMAPFTNKLAHGRFMWNGREVVLPTPAGAPHAMHGLGHRVPWELADASDTRAVLRYRHVPGREGWPWAFELGMDVTVSAQHVQVDLQIRNTSPEAMPAGLGWHPFHPAWAGAGADGHLTLSATARRDAGPQGLAVLLPADARDLAQRHLEVPTGVAQSTVFEGWSGRLCLPLAQDLQIEVQAQGAPHLFCHVPAQAQHLCLEPVTLLPGALRNYDAALRAAQLALAPGAVRAIRWRCSARSRW